MKQRQFMQVQNNPNLFQLIYFFPRKNRHVKTKRFFRMVTLHDVKRGVNLKQCVTVYISDDFSFKKLIEIRTKQ